MKYVMLSVMYAGFFAVIGFAIFYTKSAYPIWALILTPGVTTGKND